MINVNKDLSSSMLTQIFFRLYWRKSSFLHAETDLSNEHYSFSMVPTMLTKYFFYADDGLLVYIVWRRLFLRHADKNKTRSTQWIHDVLESYCRIKAEPTHGVFFTTKKQVETVVRFQLLKNLTSIRQRRLLVSSYGHSWGQCTGRQVASGTPYKY